MFAARLRCAVGAVTAEAKCSLSNATIEIQLPQACRVPKHLHEHHCFAWTMKSRHDMLRLTNARQATGVGAVGKQEMFSQAPRPVVHYSCPVVMIVLHGDAIMIPYLQNGASP